MNNKQQQLLKDLGMYQDGEGNYFWRLQTLQQLSLLMLDSLTDDAFKHVLSMTLEKMRYEMFDYIAKQQKILHDYDTSDTPEDIPNN